MCVPQNTAVHKQQNYRIKKVLHVHLAYVHITGTRLLRFTPHIMRSAYVSISVMILIPHKKKTATMSSSDNLHKEVKPLIKGYVVPYGYMGLVSGNYILFATESDYLDYMT